MAFGMNIERRVVSLQKQRTAKKPVKKAVKQQKQHKTKPAKAFGWKSILGVSLVFAALIAVLAAPSPYTPPQGGIFLVGSEPEVAVYGPELPENLVEGYSQPVGASSIVASSETEDNTLYVYAADGASCYHLGTCKFAFASAQRLTILEAHFLGYTPCGLCEPPPYTG